jgi:hypothetical protein
MENMNDLPNPNTQNGLLAYYKFNGDYINVQGNAAYDGIPQGTPTFDVEAPIIEFPKILDIQTTAASCFGFNDGSLNISATGNQITYSIDGVNFGTDSTFSNLLGGSYTAVIESINGCRAQQTVVIDQPDQVPTPILQTNVPICEGEPLVLYVDSIDNADCFWIGPNGFEDTGYNVFIDEADPNIHSGEYAIFAIRNGCSSDTLRQTIVVNPIYNLTIDARKYIKLWKYNILALQAFGNFNEGNIPFKQLATIGSDAFMRGYYNGRFRDNHAMAFQAELRKQVWGPVSITAFGGFGNVANQSSLLFENVKPNYGAGLRVMAIRRDRVNIRIDYGRGENGIQGMYFTMNEAF